jgi:hypothetical protein
MRPKQLRYSVVSTLNTENNFSNPTLREKGNH